MRLCHKFVNEKLSFSLSPNNSASLTENLAVVNFYPRQLTISEFCRLILLNPAWFWSPITFKRNYRNGKNFSSASMIVLDFDDGTPSLSEAIERVSECGMAVIVTTTVSHQKEKRGKPKCDRYRIIYPTSSECKNVDEYCWNMRQHHAVWPDCDPACKGPAQYYRHSTEIVYQSDGEAIAWNPLPPNYYQVHENYRTSLNIKYDHSDKENLINWTIAQACDGTRNKSLYSLARLMFEAGYTPEGVYGRIAGTIIMDQEEDRPGSVNATIKSAYRGHLNKLSIERKEDDRNKGEKISEEKEKGRPAP